MIDALHSARVVSSQLLILHLKIRTAVCAVYCTLSREIDKYRERRIGLITNLLSPTLTFQSSSPVKGCFSPNQQDMLAELVVGVVSVGRVEDTFLALQLLVLQVHTVPL